MVDESMLRALGRVVVNFNAVEHWLATWTGQLIVWDPIIGEIVTAEMSFKNLLALFSSLCKYRVRDESLLQEVKNAVALLAQAEQQRNELVHCCWLERKPGEPHKTRKTTAKQKKGHHTQFKDVSVQDVNALADRMRDIDYLLTLLAGKLLGWIPKEKRAEGEGAGKP